SHLDHGVLTQVRTQNIGDRLRTSLGQVEVVGGVTCRVGVPGYHDGQLWSAVFVDQVGGGLYVLSHGFGEGVVVVAEVVDETAAVHDHGFGRLGELCLVLLVILRLFSSHHSGGGHWCGMS